jgi:ubiquinone/menaquinone biosynthesis C-methylase UbiE
MKDEHARFAGSIPAAYDRYLGPVLFQPYAEDLVARLQVPDNGAVLELACGTGIVTRELRSHLPATVKLIATDLNEPMFQHAAPKFARNEAVEWQQADASSLPFGDGIFDAVVCQFGIMFVPDKALAAREARRVLKPGGIFLFNVWDALEHNELGRIAHETIAGYFDKDPPMFYQVPFGYHDHDEIKEVLEDAGFRNVRIDVVDKASGASRAEDTATGLVQGNPVSVAIAERDPSLLPVITNAIAVALKRRFGEAEMRAPLRAIVVQARA